jgi:hypothetical protein
MQLAGGGIIAFAAGDQVKAPKSRFPTLTPNPGRDDFRTFLEEQVRSNMTDTTDPFTESKAMSQQYADELKARPEQDLNMAMLSAAGDMMAGDSPYFFSNVGRGVQGGAKSLAAANQQKQADKRLLLQQKVETEKSAEARKAQRALGAERNLTDMLNRDVQGQTAELSAQAQILAAQIGRTPTPSEFDKYMSTKQKLEALDPKGELGLVDKFKADVKDFYSARTTSDENTLTKSYAAISKDVRETLAMDPKWQKINKDDPVAAERIARQKIIEQTQQALDFGKGKGASSGGSSTSGKYSNMSNDELLNLLKK